MTPTLSVHGYAQVHLEPKVLSSVLVRVFRVTRSASVCFHVSHAALKLPQLQNSSSPPVKARRLRLGARKSEGNFAIEPPSFVFSLVRISGARASGRRLKRWQAESVQAGPSSRRLQPLRA